MSKDLKKEEEVEIFRKVCGAKKVVTNDHINVAHGNETKDGLFNQGVSKVKLKEYIEKNKLDFSSWRGEK